jgi:hypothetical protein
MDIAVSDLIVGLIVSILGLLGLLLAAGATDDGIYIFGLSLTGFAVIFVLGLIRRHYDKRDQLRSGGGHHV